jgi:hypothetical protein
MSGMRGWLRCWIAHAYVAGMIFFFFTWAMGLGVVEMGIILGLLAALVVEPILETIDRGNRARDIAVIFRFRLAGSVFLAVGICILLAYIRSVVGTHFFEFDFEPISFGVLYGAVYTAVTSIISRIAAQIRKKRGE